MRHCKRLGFEGLSLAMRDHAGRMYTMQCSFVSVALGWCTEQDFFKMQFASIVYI